MAVKTQACRILDRYKTPYTVVEYGWDENALDAVTVAEKIGVLPDHIFKTLVLRGDKTGILMACVPGSKEIDVKALASVSGNKKVEMVPVKEIQSLTGYIRGGVSPLGVKKKYPLYVDDSMIHVQQVSISAGQRGLQILLKGTDLIAICDATLVNIGR